jgi:hypothetical protein
MEGVRACRGSVRIGDRRTVVIRISVGVIAHLEDSPIRVAQPQVHFGGDHQHPIGDDEPTQPRGNAAAILTIVLVSYFMILLDNSIIFTALPSIDSALNLSVTGLSWVQDAYDLTIHAYKALETLLADGKVRAIGVSNFMPEHLTRLLEATTVVPAVNQIEVHPYFRQSALLTADTEHGPSAGSRSTATAATPRPCRTR